MAGARTRSSRRRCGGSRSRSAATARGTRSRSSTSRTASTRRRRRSAPSSLTAAAEHPRPATPARRSCTSRSTTAAGRAGQGPTVAELGAMNTPLDMVSYERDGEEYLLVSNTRHPLMKIACRDIDGRRRSPSPREPLGVPREDARPPGRAAGWRTWTAARADAAAGRRRERSTSARTATRRSDRAAAPARPGPPDGDCLGRGWGAGAARPRAGAPSRPGWPSLPAELAGPPRCRGSADRGPLRVDGDAVSFVPRFPFVAGAELRAAGSTARSTRRPLRPIDRRRGRGAHDGRRRDPPERADGAAQPAAALRPLLGADERGLGGARRPSAGRDTGEPLDGRLSRDGAGAVGPGADAG